MSIRLVIFSALLTTICNFSKSSLIPLADSTTDINQIIGVDSDYFLIETKPTLLPIATAGNGVFAKYDIPASAVLCEFRGGIVHEKDFSRMKNTSRSFFFNGPNEQTYQIVGNSICSRFNDCSTVVDRSYTLDEFKTIDIDAGEGIPCFDGTHYNAAHIIVSSGKVVVVANSDIKAGQEIFVPYGWSYWRSKVRIDIGNGRLYSINDLSILPGDISTVILRYKNGDDGLTQNIEYIDAVDSDFLNLEIRDSTLPISGAGRGVFAKFDIPADSILCEYRGTIIRGEDSDRIKDTSKMFGVLGLDGEKYDILGDTLCAFINDCTSLLEQSAYTIDELNALELSLGKSCFQGTDFNATPRTLFASKIIIIADRDIKAGEEIFYSYGWGYWRNRLLVDVGDGNRYNIGGLEYLFNTSLPIGEEIDTQKISALLQRDRDRSRDTTNS